MIKMEFLTLLIIFGSLSLFAVIIFIIVKQNKTERFKLTPKLTIAVESDNFEYCGVKLINKGKGTAIIKKVDFWEDSNSNGSDVKKSLDQIFPFNKHFWMSNSSYDEDREYYLAGGDYLYFGKLMKERVTGKGKDYIKIKDIFEDKIRDISIKVEYDDVFAKKQKPFVFNH